MGRADGRQGESEGMCFIFLGHPQWAHASPSLHRMTLEFDPPPGENVEQGLFPTKLELTYGSMER